MSLIKRDVLSQDLAHVLLLAIIGGQESMTNIEKKMTAEITSTATIKKATRTTKTIRKVKRATDGTAMITKVTTVHITKKGKNREITTNGIMIISNKINSQIKTINATIETQSLTRIRLNGAVWSGKQSIKLRELNGRLNVLESLLSLLSQLLKQAKIQ